MDKGFVYENSGQHATVSNQYSSEELEQQHDNTIRHFLANFDQSDYQDALDLTQINQILDNEEYLKSM
jgi:hypothetical protein